MRDRRRMGRRKKRKKRKSQERKSQERKPQERKPQERKPQESKKTFQRSRREPNGPAIGTRENGKQRRKLLKASVLQQSLDSVTNTGLIRR